MSFASFLNRSWWSLQNLIPTIVTLFSRAENDTNHELFYINQPNFFFSTAVFLKRNENNVMADRDGIS